MPPPNNQFTQVARLICFISTMLHLLHIITYTEQYEKVGTENMNEKHRSWCRLEASVEAKVYRYFIFTFIPLKVAKQIIQVLEHPASNQKVVGSNAGGGAFFCL